LTLASAIFLPLAELDLENTFATIKANNPKAADEFRIAIAEVVDYLSRNPLAKPADEHNDRYWVVKRYSCSIVYEFDGENVLVIAISADRRDVYWR
jgi:plasmid stabilization system protein ParE